MFGVKRILMSQTPRVLALGLTAVAFGCSNAADKPADKPAGGAKPPEKKAAQVAPEQTGTSGQAAVTADAKTAQPADTQAGLRIYLDEKGNRTTPPPGAAQAGAPSLNRSTAGLKVEDAPGGGKMVRLEGRFESYSVATIGPDGKLKVDCVQEPPASANYTAPSTDGKKE